MDKIAVEQNTLGSTYRSAPAAGAAEQALSALGGFAISFEELLQRVGAKIENAFSAADRSHGIATSRAEKPAEPAPKDNTDRASARDDHAQRGDDRSAKHDDRKVDAGDRKRDANDGNDTAGRADNGNKRADRADDTSRDDTAARDAGNDTSADDATAKDGSADAAATDGGANQDQNAQAGNGQGAQNAAAGQNTQAANAAAEAAMQMAGIVGQAASQNATAGDAKQGEQAAAVANVQQTANTGELARAQQQYGAAAKKKGENTHQANGKVDVTAGKGEQAVAKTAEGPVVDPIKDQAQKIAQVIGKEDKVQINVTVQDDRGTLTSKPTASLAGSVSLAADDAAQNAAGRQQQGGAQNQNAGNQAAQQFQAAAMQQAQAQQQAQGPQGAGAGTANTGLDATSGPRAAGASVHGVDGANNTQLTSGTQQAQQAASSRETSAAQQAQQAQRANLPGSAVVDQISVKITKALQTGTDKISIQLKPAELGRVDVKMEMTHDGRVMTVVTAERQETLDMLRRDQSELQRALADAGLQSGDMEFNLKGQEQQTADKDGGQASGSASGEETAEAADEAAPDGAVLSAWESGIYFNGRLDLRA